MTAKGTQTHNRKWHKQKEKKRLKRARIRKSHDFTYRMTKGSSIQQAEADRKFKEAQEREAKKIVSKNWFIRQFIKLKLFIKRLWQKKNSRKSKR